MHCIHVFVYIHTSYTERERAHWLGGLRLHDKEVGGLPSDAARKVSVNAG